MCPKLQQDKQDLRTLMVSSSLGHISFLRFSGGGLCWVRECARRVSMIVSHPSRFWKAYMRFSEEKHVFWTIVLASTSSLTFECSEHARVLRVWSWPFSFHSFTLKPSHRSRCFNPFIWSLFSYSSNFCFRKVCCGSCQIEVHFAIIVLFHFGKNSALFFLRGSF